jgi:hypothetical protein
MAKIYKARLVDCGNRRMRDSGSMARRTLVATFPGTAFVSERDGSDLKVFILSDDTVQTGVLGDYATRANTGGPDGWGPHIDECKAGLKDHGARLKDAEGRLDELEKDPSGARVTVSDRTGKGRNSGMTASRLQKQIEAHRGTRNDRG